MSHHIWTNTYENISDFGCCHEWTIFELKVMIICYHNLCTIVKFLNIETDGSEQTVQIQIRLPDLGLHCLLFYLLFEN